MEKTVPVTLVTKAKNITITDWQGRSRKVLVQNGKVQLTLTTWLQYVTGAGSGRSASAHGEKLKQVQSKTEDDLLVLSMHLNTL